MLTAVTGDIYNNIHEYNVLTCSTHVLSELEVNINMSLCTRGNRCQEVPFTCCSPYCISLIYFSFTKIRMFLYARIYWLAEFGDVYSLLTIWEWRLSLRPGRILSDNFKSDTLFKSDETLCPTWEYDRWYTWRDLYVLFLFFFKSVPISIYLNNNIVFGIS
jgi:hypothetical protein